MKRKWTIGKCLSVCTGGRVRQIRENAESKRGMSVQSINFDNQSIHFGSDSISLQIQYWTGVFTMITLNHHL